MLTNAALKKSAHPDLVLEICCLSVLLIGMDVTIVNVALPSIQTTLHASLSEAIKNAGQV
jgi:MFS family permease